MISGRFKGDKLFTEVKNKPLILYPIETFLNSGSIDTLVIVCNKKNKNKIKQLLLNIETNIEIDIILGGKSRQESELKALKTLKEKNVQDEDLIVIHDSARAFLPAKLLLNLIEHAKQNQSAAPYIRTLLFSKDLSEYINENIKVFTYIFMTPTSAELVVNTTIELIKSNHFGLFHLVSDNNCSWFEFTNEIFNLMNYDKEKLFPSKSDEIKQVIDRGMNTSLSNNKLKRLGIRIDDWKFYLKQYINGRIRKQNNGE